MIFTNIYIFLQVIRQDSKFLLQYAQQDYLHLIAFIVPVVLHACSFSSRQQKRYFNKVVRNQYDIIIVPGVPFVNGRWNRIMKGRVYWSKYLYDKGIARNIMYSGGAVYSPYYEGKIMALYAAALGIPQNHIYTETMAEHSTENMYYSYKLAKKLGFKSIALASDPFQTKLLRRYIRKKVSDNIAIIPFVADILKTIEPGMVDPPIDYQQAFKKALFLLQPARAFAKDGAAPGEGTLTKNCMNKVFLDLILIPGTTGNSEL